MPKGATNAEQAGLGRNHPWLGILLRPLDAFLRRRQNIDEFTDSAECIFRIQLILNDMHVRLADGTELRPGDRLMDLHFWNEHVPEMPGRGATLAWARQMHRCVEASLRELTSYLAARRDLDDVQVIRLNISLATVARFDQIIRVVSRYGFEAFPEPPLASFGARFHRLGENILISMLVLASNAATFRLSLLWRGRTLAYISRGTLEALHGS